VDICYPPIFQSGGEFELKLSAVSSDKRLHYSSLGSVIHMSVGARQGLSLVPISAQLELTLPLSAQLKLTLFPI